MPGAMPNVDLAATGQLNLGGNPGSNGVLCVAAFRDIQFAPILPLKAFNFDAKMQWGKGKQPSKFLADLGFARGSLLDGMKKCADAGAVQQASFNDVFGHGLANIEAPRIGPSIHSV